MREDDAMQSPSGDEVPLDLSALGVDQDAREREALVARIMAAAAPELKRRGSGVVPIRGGAGALGVLSQWTRPILAAAAVVGLLAAAFYDPVFTRGIGGVEALALAVAAFVALRQWALSPFVVVLAAGGIGWVAL